MRCGSDNSARAGKRGSVPRLRARSAQCLIETAVLLAIVTGALVFFFTFIRDSVASRVKIGSDTFGHGLLNNGTPNFK